MVEGETMPQVARRAQALPLSPIRGLVPLAEQAKAKGIEVIHLNIGQPDLPPPSSVASALIQAASLTPTYTPSPGLPELLVAWSRYYGRLGISIEPSQVVVTAGASEALWLAFLATTDPGDEVLVPEPFYAPYQGIMLAAGIRLVPLPPTDDYGPVNLETMERSLTPKTRGLLLCSPSNPTGLIYEPGSMQALAHFLAERGLFLYSDETYRELVFSGHRALSALEIPGLEHNVIVIDSLSKRFNAPGLRIGAVITRNPEVIEAIANLAELRLSLPVASQQAAIAALQTPLSYLAELVTTYRQRRDTLLAALAALSGVRVIPPDGALYLVAELPVDNSEHFAAWLLSDFSQDGQTVMVAPLSGFYATPGRGNTAIRIALVQPEPLLERAAELLDYALAVYPGRRSLFPSQRHRSV